MVHSFLALRILICPVQWRTLREPTSFDAIAPGNVAWVKRKFRCMRARLSSPNRDLSSFGIIEGLKNWVAWPTNVDLASLPTDSLKFSPSNVPAVWYLLVITIYTGKSNIFKLSLVFLLGVVPGLVCMHNDIVLWDCIPWLLSVSDVIILYWANTKHPSV